ncbi:MAG: prepilin-type N-terminal cleavage/methylation domain-containing protein [Pirellulales bacterium]|nr:prepilin-type N-terminal cleavage/methylation domain-containing protein [Pirellulales bacterium]
MHRRGFSLLEMVVVITVSTVLVGVSVGVLYTLMRTERTARNRVPHSTNIARLAEQFRGDVRAATRQPPLVRQGEWHFTLPDNRTVTYRTAPGEVRWEERVEGSLVRKESYILPDGWSMTIDVPNNAMPAMASLILVKDSESPTAGREIRVVAALGKDHRFSKSPGGQ